MASQDQTIFEKLVGVVGYAASGKDTVANIFKEKFGFTHISLSDILRQEMLEQGIEPSRDTQRKFANQTRKTKSPAYFIDIALQKAENLDSQRVVLSGIYSPSEGDYLQKSLGGMLLGIMVCNPDLPQERYSRMKNRADGSRDNLSYEDFLAANENESAGDYYGTNIPRLLEMAGCIISNSGNMSELGLGLEDIINSINPTGSIVAKGNEYDTI